MLPTEILMLQTACISFFHERDNNYNIIFNKKNFVGKQIEIPAMTSIKKKHLPAFEQTTDSR